MSTKGSPCSLLALFLRRAELSSVSARIMARRARGLPSPIGIIAFVCIAFALPAHSEDIQDRRNEISAVPAPLPKGRSALNDMLVPPDRRLGRFDIDLGLPAGGDKSSVQRNFMMASILSTAISTKSITASKRCRIMLHSSSYPLIAAYMRKLEAPEPSDQARRICLDVFRQIFSTIENDAAAISKAIDDLKTTDDWARGVSANSRLRSWAAISEAVRRIYDEDSTVHALLSVRSAHYATISVAQFQQWMENVRRSGRIRLLTDDTALDAERDTFERGIDAWHEMPTPKKSIDMVEVNDFGPVDVRVAVLVAVKPPSDGKLHNDVLEKYCRNMRNTKVDPADKTFPQCRFESVFHQEGWIEFYYLAEDGPDESLRRLAANIARDPGVLTLAAMKRDGDRAGHPYLVFFAH
jgi:hypothetical protein